MKTILLILLATCLVVSSYAGVPPVAFRVIMPEVPSDSLVLEGISAMESGDQPWVIGGLGERSVFQFRQNVWETYSRWPFGMASLSSPAALRESRRVALAYLRDIKEALARRGLPGSAYFIAIAWNAGPYWRRLSGETCEYAQCVENIVTSRMAERPGAAQPAAQTHVFVVATN